jgi:hypothetical protein
LFVTSLGLAAFVGLTGIHAGPIFLTALRESGIGLLLGGTAVTRAADRRIFVRPLRPADEPDSSARGADRLADGDRRDGRRPGTRGLNASGRAANYLVAVTRVDLISHQSAGDLSKTMRVLY